MTRSVKIELDKVKETLQSDLKEAKEEQAQVRARLEDKPSFGLGEGATLAYSWEMGLARLDEVTARIHAIEEALNRIGQGAYGLCENCGKAIDPERLEILPATKLCTECASQRR